MTVLAALLAPSRRRPRPALDLVRRDLAAMQRRVERLHQRQAAQLAQLDERGRP